jgi:hypothetical protein
MIKYNILKVYKFSKVTLGRILNFENIDKFLDLTEELQESSLIEV